jgi:NADP-dependent 3-hydroxy acid dehydrogenase YdfG
LSLLRVLYKVAIDADSVARAIAFAIEQPADVAINELIVRPTVQVG